MANDNRELIRGLQKEIELYEEVIAAKNVLIEEQKKVILQLNSQIDQLSGLLNEVLDMVKESGD